MKKSKIKKIKSASTLEYIRKEFKKVNVNFFVIHCKSSFFRKDSSTKLVKKCIEFTKTKNLTLIMCKIYEFNELAKKLVNPFDFKP